MIVRIDIDLDVEKLRLNEYEALRAKQSDIIQTDHLEAFVDEFIYIRLKNTKFCYKIRLADPEGYKITVSKEKMGYVDETEEITFFEFPRKIRIVYRRLFVLGKLTKDELRITKEV